MKTSLLGILGVIGVGLALLAGFNDTSAARPYGAEQKSCGSFDGGEYRISVYATEISCKKARRIQKEYWLGPKRRKVIVNGGSGAAGYILLKRFPGWRCTSGSGGGSCSKGDSVASYQN